MLDLISKIRELSLIKRSAKFMPDSITVNLLLGPMNLPDSVRKDAAEFLVKLSKEYNCSVAQLFLNDEVSSDVEVIVSMVANLLKGGADENSGDCGRDSDSQANQLPELGTGRDS